MELILFGVIILPNYGATISLLSLLPFSWMMIVIVTCFYRLFTHHGNHFNYHFHRLSRLSQSTIDLSPYLLSCSKHVAYGRRIITTMHAILQRKNFFKIFNTILINLRWEYSNIFIIHWLDFLVILKHSLQNYKKILKKCFFVTGSSQWVMSKCIEVITMRLQWVNLNKINTILKNKVYILLQSWYVLMHINLHYIYVC